MARARLAMDDGPGGGRRAEVFGFGNHVVEVVAHSRNPGYAMAFPGVRVEPPAQQPFTIADLPEARPSRSS